jgi:2-polyprenyl-3-methyl-5-hydroxy-6-metoxy-1,4-benzoquinol methylase
MTAIGRKSPHTNFAQTRPILQGLSLIAVAVAIGMSVQFPPLVSAFLPQTTTATPQIHGASFWNTGPRSTATTRVFMAGFGSPTQGSSKQKKKGKNKTKGKGGSGETAAQAQQRWANKLKRVYGGTSAEEIAAGTEKRIGSMIVESLNEPLRRALELREIVQGFERKISGMEAEDIRQRFSKEELDRAIANRKAFDKHMEANNLVPEELQVAMQRLTWDASADAKACKSVTGTMPRTFKNRVTKASEMAYEALLTNNKDDDDDDGMVLDIGCGYGVLVPFLKKAGFKAHQIHGVDLSSEMIGHAKTFYPDVASKGKFEAIDFLAETNNSNKYRAVVFCSALHDMPDLKSALLKSKNELLDTEETGSRLVIVHAQGASHVLNQHKQNPLLVPRGLPTRAELEEWLCGEGGPAMKIVHEPAQPKSQGEVREGYLAVLETI